MTRLFVSMGLADRAGAPRRPRVRVVDADRGVVLDELAFEAAHAPSLAAHQEATSASFTAEGLLLQPAHTELLWIDPASLRIVRRVSHPLFHGVHSATESADGTLVVTCAGLDSVLELAPDGELLRHHWLRAGRFADAYGGVTDFRTVDHKGFDPHSHHPNHALRVGDDLWATCFETRECRTVRGDRMIPLPEAIPHDGILRGGLMWFTQVDGRVVAVDPVTLSRRVDLDLRTMTTARGLLGWCRGIEVVGSRLFVGMTMLRASRHREVLRMLLRGEDGAKLPTRLLVIDLDRRRIVRDTELGNAEGGTIYSVVAL
jgi:hypothetical protein